ncbi:MAG: phage tail assembly protein [Lachnospiraceae bacterium]|nr:phage tail assembly protein [Lachnospiraceae bacterium]
MAFQTEYEFVLPRGYLDSTGTLHKEGVMRLATAADEILPLKDPRVQQNPGYLTVILMSRVVTRLGALPAVDTRVVENLYTVDLAYLQDLYDKINSMDNPVYKTVCPHCERGIEVPVNFMNAGI